MSVPTTGVELCAREAAGKARCFPVKSKNSLTPLIHTSPGTRGDSSLELHDVPARSREVEVVS
jgi:hypothetical protein